MIANMRKLEGSLKNEGVSVRVWFRKKTPGIFLD